MSVVGLIVLTVAVAVWAGTRTAALVVTRAAAEVRDSPILSGGKQVEQ